MTTVNLARTTRVTRATYSVVGAPETSFGFRSALPFEIEVTWTDGVPDWDVVVRGWVMKKDGTPRRAIAKKMDAMMHPARWLFAQVSQLVEPGFEPPAPAADDEGGQSDESAG